MSPIVSIVIPVFNAEKYLPQCLDSIRCQSFKDWECILVNDGSNDASHEICNHYSLIDERFKVISQNNKGVSAARNSALKVVNGSYISFIDSDDWIESDYLEYMIQHAEDCDLVVSGQIRELSDGRKRFLVPRTDGCITIDRAHAEEFVSLEELLLLYAPHEKFFKSSIIKSNGLLFQVGCSNGEDLIFNYSYLEYAHTIRYLSRSKYHYRIVPGSLSNRFRPHQFQDDYNQWHILASFYKRHDLWCEIAEKYLSRRLWGIVYDGLFSSQEKSRQYFKMILIIPEVDLLKKQKSVFQCAFWIKWAIINRSILIFQIYKYLEYWRCR